MRNNVADTIFDDGAVDSLYGQSDQDWFIASAQDLLPDLLSGEQILDPNGL
ncbi:MAG: hypothetical protein ACKN85_03625 [Pirellula sp.]